MALFWKVTAKTCKSCGRSAELSHTQCRGCGGKLKVITTLRPRRILAFLATTGALAGAGFEGVRTFRPQQIQIMPSEGIAIEAGTLSRLSQLGARLRAIYHDCQAGERETAEVTQLLASDPALAQVYPEFQRTRLSHVLEACRMVRSGQLLVAQKLFEKARADFLKATEEDPENANAWAALGGVCMISHREEDARQAYERALAIEPESWAAHYNYGCYFAGKGETESALGHLERAVSLLGRSGNVDRNAVLDDLRQNPALGALRQDPRFVRLLDGV
jgi:Flp pilus assembly protein TadD